MTGRKKKTILALLLVLALITGLVAQHARMTRLRRAHGYDKTVISPDTPPLIVLTTVALGGFKGLFVDILWLRLIDLCKREQYFKVIPISNWIITLQPNFSSVWVFNSWNLAFNISAQFISAEDRWDWIKKALDMLRDKGTHYNPFNPRIYREMAWITLMRLSRSQDKQHMAYKLLFIGEISKVLDEAALDPLSLETADNARAADTMRSRLKMELEKMRALNRSYGPLDWRLPDAHALYWAAKSLELSKGNKDFKSTKIIQDCLRLSLIRGRIVRNAEGGLRLVPRPELFDTVDRFFDDTIAAYGEKEGKQTFRSAHSLLLQNAAFFLHNMGMDVKARRAFESSLDKYPERTNGRSYEEFLKRFAQNPMRFNVAGS